MSSIEERYYRTRYDLSPMAREELLCLWRESGAIIKYGDQLSVEISEYVRESQSDNPVVAALESTYISHVLSGDALIEVLFDYRDVLSSELNSAKALVA